MRSRGSNSLGGSYRVQFTCAAIAVGLLQHAKAVGSASITAAHSSSTRSPGLKRVRCVRWSLFPELVEQPKHIVGQRGAVTKVVAKLLGYCLHPGLVRITAIVVHVLSNSRLWSPA